MKDLDVIGISIGQVLLFFFFELFITCHNIVSWNSNSLLKGEFWSGLGRLLTGSDR